MGQSPVRGVYRYVKGRESAPPEPPPATTSSWDEPTRASQVVESLAQIEAELWRERQERAANQRPMTPPDAAEEAQAAPSTIIVEDRSTARVPAPEAAGPADAVEPAAGAEPADVVEPDLGPDAELVPARDRRWVWLAAAAAALVLAAVMAVAHDDLIAAGRRWQSTSAQAPALVVPRAAPAR